MFNFSGSEIVFLLILGLVVLGPEKLPVVLRKAGRLYGEFKRVTSDAQSDFRQAFAEPIKDFQEAANEYKSVFTSAADEVSSSLQDTVESNEPIFIPFEVTDTGRAEVADDDGPSTEADTPPVDESVTPPNLDSEAGALEEDH